MFFCGGWCLSVCVLRTLHRSGSSLRHTLGQSWPAVRSIAQVPMLDSTILAAILNTEVNSLNSTLLAKVKSQHLLNAPIYILERVTFG